MIPVMFDSDEGPQAIQIYMYNQERKVVTTADHISVSRWQIVYMYFVIDAQLSTLHFCPSLMRHPGDCRPQNLNRVEHQ